MAMPGQNRGKRPKLVPPSKEMRHRSVLLAQELLGWPQVSMRPMFGLHAFYRGTIVFAMLPDSRALENPNAVAYKLPSGTPGGVSEKWKLFELENNRDIGKALATLDKAYREAAGSIRGNKTAKRRVPWRSV